MTLANAPRVAAPGHTTLADAPRVAAPGHMTLAEIQRAFHDAVTGAAPLASARPLVREPDALARLHVYANAYFARIHGVLVADYPKLVALLGDDAFRELVVPYLRTHPTTH